MSSGVEISGPAGSRYEEILTPEALDLVGVLHRELGQRRLDLLQARAVRQDDLSAGGTLDFLTSTEAIRSDTSWRVAPPAPGLIDRRGQNPRATEEKNT